MQSVSHSIVFVCNTHRLSMMLQNPFAMTPTLSYVKSILALNGLKVFYQCRLTQPSEWNTDQFRENYTFGRKLDFFAKIDFFGKMVFFPRKLNFCRNIIFFFKIWNFRPKMNLFKNCCVKNAEIHLFLIFLELFRYEKRYGPDTFVAHLASPLKSTTYNGLDSYNPNKYIGMFYKKELGSIRYLTKIYS